MNFLIIATGEDGSATVSMTSDPAMTLEGAVNDPTTLPAASLDEAMQMGMDMMEPAGGPDRAEMAEDEAMRDGFAEAKGDPDALATNSRKYGRGV